MNSLFVRCVVGGLDGIYSMYINSVLVHREVEIEVPVLIAATVRRRVPLQTLGL